MKNGQDSELTVPASLFPSPFPPSPPVKNHVSIPSPSHRLHVSASSPAHPHSRSFAVQFRSLFSNFALACLGRRVKHLATLQHFQNFPHSPFPRLRLPRRLQPVNDRINIGLAQPLVKNSRLWESRQGLNKILRRLGVPLGIVRRLPPPIRPRCLDRRQPGGSHQAGPRQSIHMPDVHPGPRAPRPSRRESQQPPTLAARLPLPVDPPKAKRLVERLRIRHRSPAGALLPDLQPNAIRGRVIRLEPCAKFRRGIKGQDVHRTTVPPVISQRIPTVFQFRVVANNPSFFSIAPFESLVFP